ncbi:unnamed protein product [Cuscuta europaea]|uniref:Uncharacterized protein n=1 Tax=Cuscuta europaea TaxID=41803 RepID=A0A9P0ZCZ4_CUSEU|nr:unnamed protein product [Cuscuta europaea]
MEVQRHCDNDEAGAMGSYLKDSKKTEMYKKHKENPGVYTIEKLAKKYRIMSQRVHTILYLKGLEEEEEKKLGHPIHSTLETFIDNNPEGHKLISHSCSIQF